MPTDRQNLSGVKLIEGFLFRKGNFELQYPSLSRLYLDTNRDLKDLLIDNAGNYITTKSILKISLLCISQQSKACASSDI